MKVRHYEVALAVEAVHRPFSRGRTPQYANKMYQRDWGWL